MGDKIRVDRSEIKTREEWPINPATKVLKSRKDYDRHREKEDIEHNIQEAEDLEDLRRWFKEKNKVVTALVQEGQVITTIPEFFDVVEMDQQIVPVLIEAIHLYENSHWIKALEMITGRHSISSTAQDIISEWLTWYEDKYPTWKENKDQSNL